MEKESKIKSRWWYLLPIFFNVIGGVIAYFILRDDDPKKAKNCLLLGIALIVIKIILTIIFFTICTTVGPCAEFNDGFMGGMMNSQQMQQMMNEPQGMNQWMNTMMGGQMMEPGMMQGSSVSQSLPTGEPTQTRTFEIFLDEIKIFAETENESGEEEIVEVEIHQWNPNSIVVNKDDTVVLKISNPRGSIHSFAIPQFGVSTGNLEPRGGTETIEFVADKTGVFTFICNTPYVPEQNWCSADHTTMTGTIIVLE